MVEWVSAECDGCGWKAPRMMKSSIFTSGLVILGATISVNGWICMGSGVMCRFIEFVLLHHETTVNPLL